MSVVLNEHNEAVVWGDIDEGRDDIPKPPESITNKEGVSAKWDEAGEEWLEVEQRRVHEAVRREKVSTNSKTTFRNAREAGDLQTQLDILFEIVTGEKP